MPGGLVVVVVVVAVLSRRILGCSIRLGYDCLLVTTVGLVVTPVGGELRRCSHLRTLGAFRLVIFVGGLVLGLRLV